MILFCRYSMIEMIATIPSTISMASTLFLSLTTPIRSLSQLSEILLRKTQQ